jgi:hypothetical protein
VKNLGVSVALAQLFTLRKSYEHCSEARMTLSSIDDAVEHWILDASSLLVRLQPKDWRLGQVLASHQRTLFFLAYVALNFFFTPLALIALVLLLLFIGGVAIWLQRMASVDCT